MTKRASGKFKRRERDAYDTPPEAVTPLVPYLPAGTTFTEPCAGSGKLLFELESHAIRCNFCCDISPRPNPEYRGWSPMKFDALKLGAGRLGNCDYIITNPPWDRPILHRMIEHFRQMRPTWLLIDANWMHTKQASEHLEYCAKIIAIGRVSWMGNDQSGFDDSCWYLFENEPTGTVFIGRN